jgi:hypothetical protein
LHLELIIKEGRTEIQNVYTYNGTYSTSKCRGGWKHKYITSFEHKSEIDWIRETALKYISVSSTKLSLRAHGEESMI